MAKKNDMEKNSNILPLMIGLFTTSLSMFVFQVVLTRLLSTMFQYHFVFLLTSMAIFGSGIGGLIAYKLGRRNAADKMMQNLPVWSFLLSASYIAVFILTFKLPFMNFILAYSVLAIIPYIIGGIFISSVFGLIPSTSHRLYFADLFGSALGSITVIIFLNRFGIANTVLLISGLVSLSSLFVAFEAKRRSFTVIASVLTAGIILTGSFQQAVGRFETLFIGYFTSPTTSLASFRASKSNIELIDSVWDAFSRTDLINIEEDSTGMVISMDGGSNSRMLRIDGDIEKYQSLKKDLNYLPFAVGKQDRVLLIGPGGGKDVVLALLGESKEIDAVEINAGSIELVKKYGKYNGEIYNRDNVNVIIQDGRNYVKETDKKYDTIYLSQVMTGSAETIGFALAENFIYTKEAVKDYWNALNADGKIAFILHDEEDLSRIVYTVLETLQELGVTKERIGEQIIVVNRGTVGSSGHGMIHAPLLVVGKSPFSPEQIKEITDKISEDKHTALYYPGITVENPVSAIVQNDVNMEAVYKQIPKNFKPTTDNKPFFFDYSKGINSILLLLMVAVTIIASMFYRALARDKVLRKPSLYFMGIGMAYMLIEIPLTQKFSLLLGHPSRSFVVIMTALLLGSGIGSLFGGWKAFRLRNRYIPLLIVTILTIAVNILSTRLMNQWFVPSLSARTAITFLAMLPLGFFMGMPFPFGIKAIGSIENGKSIPLAWGINGILSVGGSVLGVILSMKLGFAFTLGMGTAIYLLLFLFMPTNYLKA